MSGAGMGTVGMRAMDLEMRMRDTGGARCPSSTPRRRCCSIYLSWGFPLMFLVTLVDSEKRFLHDILVGRGDRSATVKIFIRKLFAKAIPVGRDPF